MLSLSDPLTARIRAASAVSVRVERPRRTVLVCAGALVIGAALGSLAGPATPGTLIFASLLVTTATVAGLATLWSP